MELTEREQQQVWDAWQEALTKLAQAERALEKADALAEECDSLTVTLAAFDPGANMVRNAVTAYRTERRKEGK